jgi:hypothetical protein
LIKKKISKTLQKKTFKSFKKIKIQMKMSTHEDDEFDNDQEEINVDDVDDTDSRVSYGSNGSNGSEIDLDGNGSCYDDSETVIR